KLQPSIFLDAIKISRRDMMDGSADRLLHNFLHDAGLPRKGPVYGGWADTIAGPTPGHCLSFLSEWHAQTDHDQTGGRVACVVPERARCHKADGSDLGSAGKPFDQPSPAWVPDDSPLKTFRTNRPRRRRTTPATRRARGVCISHRSTTSTIAAVPCISRGWKTPAGRASAARMVQSIPTRAFPT
ncbi:MAG: beta-L-arabinofuranosidase domain-containing protein, partial [Rhodanobacter sp.]